MRTKKQWKLDMKSNTKVKGKNAQSKLTKISTNKRGKHEIKTTQELMNKERHINRKNFKTEANKNGDKKTNQNKKIFRKKKDIGHTHR